MLHIGAMAENGRAGRTTAAHLIEHLQRLPPTAEVVTSIYGWEGPHLGPVTLIEMAKVDDSGLHFIPTDVGGRTVYVLDAPR